MTLAEIEDEICRTYLWWAEKAFGVTPKEVGRLAYLWFLADEYYAKEEA